MEPKIIEVFNVEAFVEEIRARPAIWDTANAEYSDKIKRNAKWREVFSNFCEGFNEKDTKEQESIGKDLVKNFKRECDSRKLKSGAKAKRRNPYQYYDLLSFLLPVFTHHETISSVSTPENIEDEPDGSQLSSSLNEASGTLSHSESTPSQQRGSTRKKPMEGPIMEVCKILKDSLESRKEADAKQNEKEDEDDKLFFHSLLKYVKGLSGIDKLSMMAEILQIVTKYYTNSQEKESSSSQYSAPQQYASSGCTSQPQQLLPVIEKTPSYYQPGHQPHQYSTPYQPTQYSTPYPPPQYLTPYQPSQYSTHSNTSTKRRKQYTTLERSSKIPCSLVLRSEIGNTGAETSGETSEGNQQYEVSDYSSDD